VAELKRGYDRNHEVPKEVLDKTTLKMTADPKDLDGCTFFVVAVPTPVDKNNVPDLTPVIKASEFVGKHLKKGAVVVYESTVYPGVTEDICGKRIEEVSGLKAGQDFFLGYSPERVNPGDKERTIEKIIKVVSGQTPEVLDVLAKLYGAVIKAGVHRAATIRTAEACKLIENIQRDVNIAIVNELAMLFDDLKIDTRDVLEAAGTKWNFLPFRPGLVGGHCIGVDPYYLNHQASGIGYHPEVIAASRRVNDRVAVFVARKTLSMIMESGEGTINKKAHVGILGVTFKEDVPDIRNTKVIEMADALEKMGARVSLVDPVADVHDVEEEYGRKLTPFSDLQDCDAIIVAVRHKEFLDQGLEALKAKLGPARILLDVKGCYSRDEAQRLSFKIWRL
jgi:UDP-N-acetyl-D-galactosamine dehydrogenase